MLLFINLILSERDQKEISHIEAGGKFLGGGAGRIAHYFRGTILHDSPAMVSAP